MIRRKAPSKKEEHKGSGMVAHTFNLSYLGKVKIGRIRVQG
jgi:hypothetical protein